MVKYYRKNDFVDKVYPANLTLFAYVSTYYVETVKWIDTFSCLGGIEVTRQTAVREVPVIFPAF